MNQATVNNYAFRNLTPLLGIHIKCFSDTNRHCSLILVGKSESGIAMATDEASSRIIVPLPFPRMPLHMSSGVVFLWSFVISFEYTFILIRVPHTVSCECRLLSMQRSEQLMKETRTVIEGVISRAVILNNPQYIFLVADFIKSAGLIGQFQALDEDQ